MYFFILSNLQKISNCKQFFNNNYRSDKLFELKKFKVRKELKDVHLYTQKCTSFISNDNIIKCYYTNITDKSVDGLSLSCITYDRNKKKIINDENNIITGNICYNFALTTLSNNLMIIGGNHYPENNEFMKFHHNCPNCNKEKKIKLIQFEGEKEDVFLSNNIFNKCFVNGLYLMDLNKKKFLNKLPIVHLYSKHKNHKQRIHFDTNLSIVYNKNIKKYILFTRSNIKRGTRCVSYAFSEDLINWSKFNYINVKNFDFDKKNYYTFMVFNYYNVYIAFALYGELEKVMVQKKDKKKGIPKIIKDFWFNSGSKVFVSNDGYTNWEEIGYFYYQKKCLYNDFIKKRIDGIYINNENFDEIFENHDIDPDYKKIQNSIFSHKFPKYSIFGLTNKNKDESSSFSTKIELKKNNKLIAEIKEDGFIMIQFEKYKFKFTKESSSFFFDLEEEKNYIVDFTFKKSNLFAIV